MGHCPSQIQNVTPAMLLFRSLLTVVGLGLASACDAADNSPTNDFLNYLTQSVCLDAAGHPMPGTPLDATCSARRSQTATDRAYYRKHDRPNANDVSRESSGYQASDSVLAERGGRTWVLQTLDFGDAPRIFAQFDAGQGD